MEPLQGQMPYVGHGCQYGVDNTQNERNRESSRRATEEANLPGRLICAQEEERRRIAAELHDDLGQDIAAMLIEIKTIRKGLTARHSQCGAAFDQIYERTVKLGEKVRQVSHQLQPVILEYVGLNAALHALCGELRKEGLEVQLAVPDREPALDAKTKLSFYRVAQESLRNVIRHSRSNFARVRLEILENTIVLTVVDQGVGFDQSRTGTGLGLLSLAQRARLIRGDFRIESSPGQGTQIRFSSRLKRAALSAKAQ